MGSILRWEVSTSNQVTKLEFWFTSCYSAYVSTLSWHLMHENIYIWKLTALWSQQFASNIDCLPWSFSWCYIGRKKSEMKLYILNKVIGDQVNLFEYYLYMHVIRVDNNLLFTIVCWFRFHLLYNVTADYIWFEAFPTCSHCNRAFKRCMHLV